MAITLDTIVNKVFKVVKNGYDNNEVEAFLDEILEEMENREAETNKLKEQVASLTRELEQARAQLAAGPAAPVAAPAKAAEDRRSSESFELVLTKAKDAYDEILTEANNRAEAIIAKANDDAAHIREDAQSQIADLTEKLNMLRKQTGDYYAAVRKAVEAQNASLEQIKKLL